MIRTTKANNVPTEHIQSLIYLVRGEKVMLDFDLATLYGVEARALNQAVKRNLDRFPDDFMFQLSAEETAIVMRSQVATRPKLNSSQIVMSSRKHRGFAYRPYAFTEQGVAMLSSVLRSRRAVRVNVEIMRTFVKLRQMLASNASLARRLDELERKYDKQFRVVFEAIRELMKEGESDEPRREIGFHTLHETSDGDYKVKPSQQRKLRR